MGALAVYKVAPEGGHIPKVGNHIADGLNNIINIGLSGIIAQGQPQGTVGNLVGAANGQQHMAGVKTAGGAGGAS